VRTLEGTEEPLNDPSQAVKLMRIIDALFASAAQGKPIQLS
jgi:predicted dehydrogenase